jgi:hypothetical protein
MIPISTSVQLTAADTMATALSNLLTRLKTLHRMNLPSSTMVCGGCHWIESPPLSLQERAVFHRLTQEVAHAITNQLDFSIEHHVIIVMKTSVHECFEQLLLDMEARDYTLDDLIQENMFIDMVTHVPGAASSFPYVVHRIACPRFMKDNDHEINVVAHSITNILKKS